MGNTSVCEIICISFALLVLADNLEWWNIVPHESETNDVDNEADDEVGVGGDYVPVKFFDSDDTDDFFDQSELLDELKELSNIQKAMSTSAGDQNKSDEELFPNSQLTVKETVILLLGIVTRHQLSGVAFDDILALIHLICPKENKMPKDSKEAFSFFQTQSQKIVKHFYCPNKNCQSYVGTMLPVQERCGLCQLKLTEEAMFLEIPVQEQLKAVLTGTLAILMQFFVASVKLTNTPALNIYMYYLHVYALQIYFFLFLACLNSNPTLWHVEKIYYSTFVERVISKITRSYRY